MAKKTVAANQKQPIISQLIIRQAVRKTSDVGTWRNALISADAGRVKTLFDLFEDLLIDGVLSDAIEKRVTAVTNSPITFQLKDGAEQPEMKDVIDTPAFEELLNTIMNHLVWGRAGGEFDFANGFNFTPIPAKHIRVENKCIVINDTDDTGIPYENDPFLLVLGKPRQFGVMLKAAPYTIWKRGGFGDYAQWLEIFGMPQRVGKYSSYDPESRKLLEEALSNAGSAPWIVIPKETEVETTNNTGTGSSGATYNDFRRACNEEILITILGQTLTTMQNETGARSLGEVHKQVEEGKNRADMRYVQRVLNQDVIPKLEARGYPVKGGKFVFPEAATELTVADIVQLSDIIEIPAQFLHDKYSIPIPEGGEQIARRSQPAAPDPGDPGNPDDPPDPDNPKPGTKVVKTPDRVSQQIKNADRSFWDRLFSFFVVSPELKAGGEMITLSDPYGTVTSFIDIDKIVVSVIDDIFSKKGKPDNSAGINEQLFSITNKILQQGAEKTFLQAGADWGRKNIEFTNQFKTNTAVFAAFKNHQQTGEIVKLLTKEDGSVRGFSEFKKEALQISENYNKQYLQTEYNTAVRGARMAVNWKKFQETKRLYPNLEYMPSRAAHPRDEHRLLWNLVFAIDDPIWDSIMPPSEWNCLCGVRATDRKATPVPAGFEFPKVNPAFANNPGKTASFVKIEETDYFGSCQQSDKALVTMFAEKSIQDLLK